MNYHFNYEDKTNDMMVKKRDGFIRYETIRLFNRDDVDIVTTGTTGQFMTDGE